MNALLRNAKYWRERAEQTGVATDLFHAGAAYAPKQQGRPYWAAYYRCNSTDNRGTAFPAILISCRGENTQP